ncbi:DNA-binding domain-containing protein [Neocallimastix lanati (nom. inval.)]|uniref:Histone H1 n=1 Tax=Neocallimastix californiae TaxID=1754190 RepID=A0A1Y2DZM8_9FUNG|nr:DNA-binding domain-containing protein [Neocallimastix sp. JGI-2020a]ORY64556.1 winged helix DNA-binding domain-containing protein [Neocallimastix californiae]|eukprot:ORY64556.1 winged helix DNA-binding domain-containing protein [Neocallimastix californiae]
MATSKTEKATTETKAKSKPDHPKYIEAIIELKDRTGSSRPAIKKYILSKYNLIESVAIKQINLTLKRGLEQKILYCPQGHSNSYKLFKQEKPKVKKPVAKKVADIKDKKKVAAKKSSSKSTAKKDASTKKAASSTKKAAATKKAATTKKATTVKKTSPKPKATTTKKASTASSTKKTIKKKTSTAASKKSKTTKSKSK